MNAAKVVVGKTAKPLDPTHGWLRVMLCTGVPIKGSCTGLPTSEETQDD
jgi:hypothetical protein